MLYFNFMHTTGRYVHIISKLSIHLSNETSAVYFNQKTMQLVVDCTISKPVYLELLEVDSLTDLKCHDGYTGWRRENDCW